MHARLNFFSGGLAASTLGVALLSGCATPSGSGPGNPALSLDDAPPIVFVHGNGDYAAAWTTTLWRFESNGWPADRLHAIEVPYPNARADDAVAQPGVTSTAEHMAYLKKEVDAMLARTGAKQVVLFANSRGGNAIRNYIQNGGGTATVSHAILGGTPNHGVWAIKGFREGNEFSGTGPFLSGLNAPKNANGDEVIGPVRWMTIRSDSNDKFAKPDGLWIGARGTATNVTAAGPELKGAQNVVIPRIDHRETSFSPAAFLAACRFIRQRDCKDGIDNQTSVLLNGRITGTGVKSDDPKSGTNPNLPVPGSRIDIYAIDPATGERKGAAVHSKVADAAGFWGPVVASPHTPYEFVVTAPSYATTHVYRSGFARSSSVVHFRPERIADADKAAGSIVSFIRPRGYFDPDRDRMSLDGKALPGVPVGVGAGESRSRLVLPAAAVRAVPAEFNGEKLVGRSWPVAENRVVVLELTQ
jgi:triacylglycerol lipase